MSNGRGYGKAPRKRKAADIAAENDLWEQVLQSSGQTLCSSLKSKRS